jgi:hypothetical protein
VIGEYYNLREEKRNEVIKMLTVFFTREGKVDFKAFENDNEVKDFYQTLPNKESIVLIQDEAGNNVEIRDVNLVKGGRR